MIFDTGLLFACAFSARAEEGEDREGKGKVDDGIVEDADNAVTWAGKEVDDQLISGDTSNGGRSRGAIDKEEQC